MTPSGPPRLSARGLLQQPLGGWRTQLVLRVIGFAALTWLLARVHGGVDAAFARLLGHHPAELVMMGAWIVIGLRGANTLALSGAAASGAWLVFGGVDMAINHPAERVVMITIPLFAVLAQVVYGLAPGHPVPPDVLARKVDRAFIAMLRVTMLLAMSFVALHKINTDFLDPALSCMNHVTGRLELWGPFGRLGAELASPWMVIASEAAVPLLLALAPRWGVLAATLLFAVFRLASFGPIAVMMTGLSFAFLADGDLARVRERRGLAGAVALGVILVFAAVALASPYSGRLSLLEIALYAFFLAGALGALAALLLPGRGALPSPWKTSEWWPADRANRALVAGFGTLTLLFCLSPYFGVTFEYSFAMFSNLRADDHRWNHLFFPRWMQVTSFPRYEIVSLKGHPRSVPSTAQAEVASLDGHLFQRTELYLAVERTRAAADPSLDWVLEVEYAGERHRFENVYETDDLMQFLRGQPRDSVFFRPAISGRSPQPCVH